MLSTTKDEKLNGDLYWLTGALLKAKKDETRAHIVNIYIKGDKAWATDGNRLHQITIDREVYVTVKDGFYGVAKRTKSAMILLYSEEHNDNGYQYPDVEGFFNDPSGSMFVVNQNEGDSSKAFTEIIRVMESNTLKYQFVNDVLSDGEVYDVTIKDCDSPVHFKCNGREAIVMPIRI